MSTSASDGSGMFAGLTQYGDPGFSRFLRRAFLASAGLDADDLTRPVIGIADTSSDYTTCHRQMPELVAAVSRGVAEAGGLPMVFPTSSLPEPMMSPTTMLYRNLLALETEEMLRALPMDGAVLVGGCDKTVPAQLMAAASANIPTILVVTGPMITGSWRGERLGACTDCRVLWARHRSGELAAADIDEVAGELVPSAGTCAVMGTASTMACLAESLGMMLPGGATHPAPSGRRLGNAVGSGRVAVALARSGRRPRDIMTDGALANAITMLAALGGSTNAVIHMLALARRLGSALSLDSIESVLRSVPLLVDIKPSGGGYLVDLDASGGVPALLAVLRPLLDIETTGVTGRRLADLIDDEPPHQEWQVAIRTLSNPVGDPGSLAVLRGSLAPDGAVIKVSAASRDLLIHRGPALVFESPEDATNRADDPALAATADSVLVLRNSGPVAAGMPESGAAPIPRRLAEAGVRDMVRVSDGRMSGTGFGTVALHCAPEAAVGGPIGMVEEGDHISIDVPNRTLDLLVDPAEMERRRARFTPPPQPARGWSMLFAERVLQADQGVDLDFM